MTLWSRPQTDTPTDEARLIAAAQADAQAFAPLYERYLGPIYRYCYLRLGSQENAEDATSEVFIKALAALPGYHGGVFIAWLFRIAANVVVDTYRRRQPTDPIAAADEIGDAAPSPEAVAIAHAERTALRAALAALPDEQRTVLELQLAGWRGDQIAAALDKTPAAVKMLRYRAVARLREIMLPEGSTAHHERS